MISILLLVIAAGVSDQCSIEPVYDEALLEQSKTLLLELESIPDGIVVTHVPVEVEATQAEGSAYKYKWDYQTSVSSSTGSVRILEFGCFLWSGDQWVFKTFTGTPFTNSDFGDWYTCTDGELVAGQQYTDPNNWTGSNCLRPQKTMWFYIGENENGEKVKGAAIVQSLAKVKVEP